MPLVDARKTSLTGVQNSKKNWLAATRLVDDAPHRRWVEPPPWKKARSAPEESNETIRKDYREVNRFEQYLWGKSNNKGVKTHKGSKPSPKSLLCEVKKRETLAVNQSQDKPIPQFIYSSLNPPFKWPINFLTWESNGLLKKSPPPPPHFKQQLFLLRVNLIPMKLFLFPRKFNVNHYRVNPSYYGIVVLPPPPPPILTLRI